LFHIPVPEEQKHKEHGALWKPALSHRGTPTPEWNFYCTTTYTIWLLGVIC